MAVVKDELEGPPENGSKEDVICHSRWAAAALAIGFNVLARDHAQDLESKTYFRIARDGAVHALKELGGNGGVSPFSEYESILELELPDTLPRVRFRESDIELMRLTVARYDVRKASVRT